MKQHVGRPHIKKISGTFDLSSEENTHGANTYKFEEFNSEDVKLTLVLTKRTTILSSNMYMYLQNSPQPKVLTNEA